MWIHLGNRSSHWATLIQSLLKALPTPLIAPLEELFSPLPARRDNSAHAAMTGKLPPVDPGQGSFDQFQLEIVGEAARIPPNQRQGALEKLSKCVPQNEGGWREAREWHSFLAPVDICKKVLSFVKEGPLSQELQRFLYIAVCCVDRHLGDKSKAYEDYRSRVHTEKLTEFTINNYMSVVLGIISLMDELYLGGYRHRAFEAVLLYCKY